MDLSGINVDIGCTLLPELDVLAESVIRFHLVPEFVLVAGAFPPRRRYLLDLDTRDRGSRGFVEQVQRDLFAIGVEELAWVRGRDSVHLLQDRQLPHTDIGDQPSVRLLDRGGDQRTLEPLVAHDMGIFPPIAAYTGRIAGGAADDVMVDKALQAPR